MAGLLRLRWTQLTPLDITSHTIRSCSYKITRYHPDYSCYYKHRTLQFCTGDPHEISSGISNASVISLWYYTSIPYAPSKIFDHWIILTTRALCSWQQIGAYSLNFTGIPSIFYEWYSCRCNINSLYITNNPDFTSPSTIAATGLINISILVSVK